MPRDDADPGTFYVACGGYVLAFTPRGLPLAYAEIKERAALVEEIALHEPGLSCITLRRSSEPWPFLVVAQSHANHEAGFEPGALLALETNVLFVGAGTRLVAYQLDPPGKIWEDETHAGFLSWEQHGDTVLLAAELEFAAWDVGGAKLWTTYVEPPWTYEVRGDAIELDVMGKKQSFELRAGPASPSVRARR